MKYAELLSMKPCFLYECKPDTHFKPREIERGMEEVEIIVSGYGDFVSPSGEEFRAGPGSMLWFVAGDVIYAHADAREPYDTYIFRFEMGRHSARRPPFRSLWLNLQECGDFCERMMKASSHGPSDAEYAQGVYGRLHWEALDFERGRDSSTLHPALRKALDFIGARYREDISIEDIAVNAGVSSPHLHLLFREAFKVSPMRMVLKRRLERAQSLLLMSDMPVKEICFEAGFRDPGNFGACFKRLCGTTPQGYRLRRAKG